MKQTINQERTFMDELDRHIIQILQVNGRASNARIARDVGVSEGTVRRRLKTLVTVGIIKVVALPNPEVLGYDTEALVGIQVDPDKIDEVAQLLVVLKESSWVAVTTGSFDIFCWVTLPTSEELGNFLKAVVGTIPGVRRTETFVSLSVRKRNYGINL
jgi:Lrp/AsnC family transcriptional regulator for asnA, asnC and gidA